MEQIEIYADDDNCFKCPFTKEVLCEGEEIIPSEACLFYYFDTDYHIEFNDDSALKMYSAYLNIIESNYDNYPTEDSGVFDFDETLAMKLLIHDLEKESNRYKLYYISFNEGNVIFCMDQLYLKPTK